MLPQNAIQKLWPEKYRPKTLDEYIFNDDVHREAFNKIVESKSIPHMLLSGIQGTGKTAIAQILIRECIDEDVRDTDVLIINASDQNSVDDVRGQIKSHILSYGMGPYKVVLLQEADYLTPNAQGILRDYMEEYEEHCRFILTCNYAHKIIPAIKSRCQQFTFKNPNHDDIVERVVQILLTEKVSITQDDVDVVWQHVENNYPDIRAIINSLQQHTNGTKLSPPASSSSSTVQDYKTTLATRVSTDDWDTLRSELSFGTSDSDWEEVFELLYKNLDSSPKFSKDKEKWGEGIVPTAEHLNRHYLSGKPHINGASLIIQLGNL